MLESLCIFMRINAPRINNQRFLLSERRERNSEITAIALASDPRASNLPWRPIEPAQRMWNSFVTNLKMSLPRSVL